ncbi:thioredoxin family protein (plasmid) [Paracoccus sp. TK19116]|uniref:Thioredoxin family protein n=1 Tax=Paracoccus albicereus TaxID=2922394 RepID=A0ABT1MLN9_9RHOB|nr:thioredoxin family protein [Paracoccus albicereus]MCQ0969205.1 thioredoxin family protein [Paracoccus albicereus]
MNLLAFTAAIAVSLAAPLPVVAEEVPGVAYTPEALQSALADGQTVLLDFKASWCPTCAAQGRVINALRAENPAYDEQITFMIADWDEWGKSQIVTDMNVPRRSTLIVLKGNQELGRVVAATSEDDIKALLDRALEG